MTTGSAVQAPSDMQTRRTLLVGAQAGLIGGVVIWLYEACVWVGVQHQMPLSGIPANAVGLVFGKATQAALGFGSYVVGTAIHFAFAMAWGVLFAVLWPLLRARRIEATLAALIYAMVAWIVMHLLIMAVSISHPDYGDPNVIIGGFMSHFFFTVPLALTVKRGLDPERLGPEA